MSRKKKSPFLKIKTVLWCYEILKRWGIPDTLIFANNKKSESLLASYQDDLAAEVYDLISDPDIKWNKYLAGTTVPYLEDSPTSNYRRILLEVDSSLPGTKEYFTDGPLKTFRVLESDTEIEAHRLFAKNVKLYCDKYEGFALEVDIPTEGFNSNNYEWIADWNEIRNKLITNDSERSFEILCGIVGYTNPKPIYYDKEENYTFSSSDLRDEDEHLFWIRLQSAFIQAKFNTKYTNLIELLFINKRGIHYFFEKYGISKEFWFGSNTISLAFSYLAHNSGEFVLEQYDFDFFKDKLLSTISKENISIQKLPLTTPDDHYYKGSYQQLFEETLKAQEEWKN